MIDVAVYGRLRYLKNRIRSSTVIYGGRSGSEGATLLSLYDQKAKQLSVKDAFGGGDRAWSIARFQRELTSS